MKPANENQEFKTKIEYHNYFRLLLLIFTIFVYKGFL